MSPRPAQPFLPGHLKRLIEAEVGGGEPRLALRSETKIDTGMWFAKSRLWVCVMDRHVVLIAASKRRYFEKLSFADCMDSYYSHTTGQLLLAPAEGVAYPNLKMSPTDALLVLEMIEQGGANQPTDPPGDSPGSESKTDPNPDPNASENSRA